MPQSIRGTLCESARKLGYVPVTRFEPQQGPEVVNIDESRLSPIWFAPPGPPCPPKDTDMQELLKTKIRITRYRQRGKPREECEVTQEEALANMLAGTSLTSGPSYEQGKSASSDFSPSLRGPEYGQRHDYICLETFIPDHLLTLSVPRGRTLRGEEKLDEACLTARISIVQYWNNQTEAEGRGNRLP
ncbi:uncharacterized protein ARMOST_07457 [Armillaria ostoyae]|uniref:Uncharacterized protein n=1 Tax=Armillaria ostoyae TaxID=47428 RepID=A0A284R5V8_ARMOS|nr:uncharacterized protein ARMOST_07457 [Armillaria ostoyae]